MNIYLAAFCSRILFIYNPSYAIPLDDGTWDERELVTVLGSHVPGVLHFICLPSWSRGSRHQCPSININGLVYNAVK